MRDKGRIERGWLGVSVQDVPGDGAGVAIAGVERNGPAARAGLRPGDVVTAVNGEQVDTSRGLIRAVAAVPPGNNVRPVGPPAGAGDGCFRHRRPPAGRIGRVNA